MEQAPTLAYVEQRSEDLTYYLFESPAPREAVQLIAQTRVSLGRGELTLAIIGSSHFLEIRTGESVICEMLACPRNGLSGIPRLVETKASEAGPRELSRSGLEYRFDLTQDLLSREEFDRRSTLLSRTRPARLVFAFPEREDDRKALTCIDWKLVGGKATITTHHTFPGELSIVATRSYVYVAEDGAIS